MVYVIESKRTGTGAGPEPETDARGPAAGTTGFGCVYLTRSVRDANVAAALVEPAEIHVYHAVSLADARMQLRTTRSRVLLADTAFERGNWREALEMTDRLRPATALVVASRLADEQLWLGVLECGAYDLVLKPFERDELCRVLENAYMHAARGALLHITA